MKPVHGNEESIGKNILKVKKEWKKNKPRRSITTMQEKKGCRIPQSNEGEDTSSNEDVGYYLRGDSSGVEVRGDSDYTPKGLKGCRLKSIRCLEFRCS